MAQIRLQDLHKSFGDFVAVRNTNMVIEDGQFFVLLGPSGCGKTTTLRMIAGLEIPDSGHIHLDDEDVAFKRARERDIAFVFQMFALYPHMNVRNNIAFPLKTEGVPRREIKQRVQETARLLRIEHLLNRAVNGLAAGDRQRVALGRAIIRRPKAFLMDEPLGTLDTEFRDLMCEELRGLHDRIGATTVFVTHDQNEAMHMADIIAVMDQGEVLQAAPPAEIYHRPKDMFVANFIGSPSMNFLDCEGRAQAGCDRIRLAGADTPVPTLHEDAASERLVFGVRPEHVHIDDRGSLRGEVFAVEYMGARQVVTVDTPAGRMRVIVGNSLKVDVGEQVGMRCDTKQVVVFEPGGRALATDNMPGAAHG